jgi:hypothetical protein
MLSNEEIAQILNKITKIKIKTKSHRERFFSYVTKLNTYVFILKNEWLQTHNFIINWKKRKMKFSQKCVKTNCIKKRKKNTKTKNKEFVNIKTINKARFFKLTTKIDHEIFLFHFKQVFEKKLTNLCTIAANKISSNDHEKFLKTKLKYTIEQLKNQVFEKYHEKIEIFFRQNVNKLIEHRKKNHEINLKFESEISYVWNYRFMLKSKLKIIKHYLNEHLTKNFIRSSTSKTSASILIIKKFENEFRIYVNYRALNAIIEKNRYSISLINETWFISSSRTKNSMNCHARSFVNILHSLNWDVLSLTMCSNIIRRKSMYIVQCWVSLLKNVMSTIIIFALKFNSWSLTLHHSFVEEKKYSSIFMFH